MKLAFLLKTLFFISITSILGIFFTFHQTQKMNTNHVLGNQNIIKLIDFEKKTDLIVFLHIPKTGGILFFELFFIINYFKLLKTGTYFEIKLVSKLKIFDKVKKKFVPACQEIETSTDKLARRNKNSKLDNVPRHKYYCSRGTMKNTSKSYRSVQKSWLFLRFQNLSIYWFIIKIFNFQANLWLGTILVIIKIFL
jgi:hypothetical protein